MFSQNITKMPLLRLLVGVGMLTFVGNALAETNILSCTTNDESASGCVLTETTVQPSGEDNFEVDIQLPYRFSCSPGRPDELRIALVDGLGRPEFLKFGATDTLRLTGVPPMKIVDSDPRRTRYSLFNAGCSLVIQPESKKVAPSAGTQEHWHRQAGNQADVIEALAETLRVVQQVNGLLSFSQQKAGVVQSALQEVLGGMLAPYNMALADAFAVNGRVKEATATLPQLWRQFCQDYPQAIKMLEALKTAEDIKLGQPHTYSDAEFNAAAVEAEKGLVDAVSRKLADAKQAGYATQARFRKWNLPENTKLANVL